MPCHGLYDIVIVTNVIQFIRLTLLPMLKLKIMYMFIYASSIQLPSNIVLLIIIRILREFFGVEQKN